MLRLADYVCPVCGARYEKLVEKASGDPWPEKSLITCIRDGELMGDYVMGAPAEYLGEKDLSPVVHGGSFDTMGRRTLPPIQDLPGAKEATAKMRAELSSLPDNAPTDARKDIMRKHSDSVPSSADYSAHFSKPEVKETFSERKRVMKENAVKRKRAIAKKKDPNINFRNTKVAGDPNFTS